MGVAGDGVSFSLVPSTITLSKRTGVQNLAARISSIATDSRRKPD